MLVEIIPEPTILWTALGEIDVKSNRGEKLLIILCDYLLTGKGKHRIELEICRP